jgi:phosphotransferase system enzyme I (PtsP)
MASRPLEAMALIGLGFGSISMAPASVGPVKSMVLSLDAGELRRWFRAAIRSAEGNLRPQLKRYAEEHGVEF